MRRQVLYHHIDAANDSDYHVTRDPELPDGVDFTSGERIRKRVPNPLVFHVDYPTRSALPHFVAETIPVLSDRLVQTLRSAGVTNFQVFPAVIRNPKKRLEWRGYWAFNAIGVLAAASLRLSKYDTIMRGDRKSGIAPMLGFHRLVLTKKKTGGAAMFRLAESRDILLIHTRVLDHIVANRPPGGWGFDETKIETV